MIVGAHPSPFSSFVIGGFECTAAQGDAGRRLDLLGATRHDVAVSEDYRLLKAEGITTVREGLAWSTIDQGNGVYDFSRYVPILQAGQREGIEQIWDLNHFDYPDGLDVTAPDFVSAFANYAEQAARLLRSYITGTLYVVPMNEISFFSWIGADKGWWAPYRHGRKQGFAFKQQLVKAAIAAMEAIWHVTDDVRFIHVDPFMRRLALPPTSRAAIKHVREFNEVIRFEAWDMLAGRSHPEVGGDPKYLDIIGVNYYIHNQEWVKSGQPNRRLGHQMMDWDSSDRVSLALMLEKLYHRYHRPLLISETGSFGEFRQRWWQRTFQEIDAALTAGLPLLGVCAYPVLDRPESAGFLLPQSGIWDFEMTDLSCRRHPHQPSLQEIRIFQEKLKQ